MRAPVMMVHGMCCTGEVWAQFRTFFEARGARVYTPTLRPLLRVRRDPPAALRELGFADYVSDLEAETARIEAETGSKPVVIGHSMGGLLAQALAERNRVLAAVLISPAAPADCRTPSARVLWAVVGLGSKLGLTPKVIMPNRANVERAALNVVPASERAAAFAGMVHESGRAFVEHGRFTVDESKIRVPILTVAATKDRLVPAALVRLTGKKYERVGGELREYADHAHWLYGEPGWEKPAAEIYDWLSARV
ncbi:MAG: alpha/beta hydrolase [Polyangiales bacterium]